MFIGAGIYYFFKWCSYQWYPYRCMNGTLIREGLPEIMPFVFSAKTEFYRWSSRVARFLSLVI